MAVVTVVKQKKKEDQDKGLISHAKAAMETYTSKCACKNELFYRQYSSQLLNMTVFEVNEIHL